MSPFLITADHIPAGSYQQALQCYKQIHKRFPENIDCLKFLVRLCTDLGLKEAQEYSIKLRKAEKAREARRQVGTHGLPGVAERVWHSMAS